MSASAQENNKTENKASVIEEELIQSPGRLALTNFLSNKLAIIGMSTFAFIFICCFFLPVFFPLEVSHVDSYQQHIRPGLNLMRIPRELRNNGLRTMDIGSSFSVGVDNSNNIHVWGNTPQEYDRSPMPRNMGNIVLISCGMDHVLALNDRGQVFTWGNNRLGLGTIPPEVSFANIIYVSAGTQISLAVDDEHNIHVWGNRNLIDVRPELFQGEVRQIVFNDSTAFALARDGHLYALSTRDALLITGVPEWAQGRIQAVATTRRDAAALLDDGTVYVWGNNTLGAHDIPEEIQGRVVDIGAGRAHFTVLLDDGTVASWGDNYYWQTKTPNISGIRAIYIGAFQNYALNADGRFFTWGLPGYLMGTDNFGRDVFRRLLQGGRISLTVGAIAVLISSIIGITLGGIAGFFHGKVDIIIMRLCEVVASIPFLPIVLILSIVVGARLPNEARIVMIMIVLGFLNWPGITRLTRGQILVEREKEFVTAAKALGVKERVIISRHILPNIFSVILVNVTISLATIMLFEATLAFLGFGVMEPAPSWGNMLQNLTSINIRYQWWRWVFPAVTLSFAVISISMIGDALRDAIDPKLNSR